MIIVVTGMVGIDKKKYLEDLCVFSADLGKELVLFNVGDEMYAEAPDIAPGKILDVPLQRLRSLRRSVFKDIINKSRSGKDIIVNTHATFRWRHGLFPAFDFDQMRQLDADIYMCLVDSVDALHVRLVGEHEIGHSLKDLLVWREEELLATELMRQAINENAKYYCLGRGDDSSTIETCYRLMYEQNRPRTYLSFPITHVMDMPDVLEDIAKFRDVMKHRFTCFDPADVEEAYMPYYAKKAVDAGQTEFEHITLGQKVRFSAAEVQRVERDINAQIYTRDFALIDQADMIISYIPELAEGRAAISSGVERELQHAHEAGKDVYVIWTPSCSPSVFVTQTATRVFRSVDEAVGYFDKRYRD